MGIRTCLVNRGIGLFYFSSSRNIKVIQAVEEKAAKMISLGKLNPKLHAIYRLMSDERRCETVLNRINNRLADRFAIEEIKAFDKDNIINTAAKFILTKRIILEEELVSRIVDKVVPGPSEVEYTHRGAHDPGASSYGRICDDEDEHVIISGDKEYGRERYFCKGKIILLINHPIIEAIRLLEEQRANEIIKTLKDKLEYENSQWEEERPFED